MARDYGPIYGWHRGDTIPTEAEGGYAGAASTAAAVGASLAQSTQAVQTVDNLAVTATTLPAGSSATATISGSVPNKTINVGIPRGAPGMGYEEGQQLLAQNQTTLDAAQAARADASALVDDYGNLVTLAQQAQAASLEVPDDNVSALVGNPATLTHAALAGPASPVVGKGDLVINAADYGVVGDGVTDNTAALDAAATAAAGGDLYLPPGVIAVTGGWSLAGKSCSIRGVGAAWKGGSGGTPVRSVIRAVNQSGPVMDFNGFDWGFAFRGAIQFSDLAVEGDGLPDATKANAGISVPDGDGHAGAGIAVWRNIVVAKTGGPCFVGEAAYFHNFENVRFVSPVNATTNDVPHLHGKNMSGCDINVDLYATAAVENESCAPSGAVVLGGDGVWPSDLNNVNVRVENLHIPTGGTLIHNAGNRNRLLLRVFDVSRQVGATDVTFIRLAPTGLSRDLGGNEVSGVISGDNGAEDALDYGIDIRQSNNRVVAVKGFQGSNVRVRPEARNLYVSLEGSVSTASNPGIIDEARHASNTLLDWTTHPGSGRRGIVVSPSSAVIQSSVTLDEHPSLRLPVDARGLYRVELEVQFYSASGLRLSLALPVGASGGWSVEGPADGTTSPSSMMVSRTTHSAGGTAVLGGAGGGPSGSTTARVSGFVRTATTPGEIVLLWAQGTSAATNTVIQTQSIIHVTRVDE